MGLDISWYRNLKELDCVFNADGEPIDPITRKEIGDTFKVYANPDFPGRETPLKSGTVYRYGESEHIHAGSYGAYNYWREQLAKIAGYEAIAVDRYGTPCMRHDAGAYKVGGGPFFELICFSDCEGVIGADIARKLAKDFADFQDKANAEDPWFRTKYGEWRIAFEKAADNGAVDFH